MKRFRFPLDAVLRWRESALEQEEQKLRNLLAEEQRILRSIEQARGEGVAAEQSIRKQREMFSTDLRSLAAFRLHLEQRLKAMARQRADQAALVEQQRRALLEAERRFRLMLKLRDRRLAEWQYEATRENETFAQEAFLGRWAARKRLPSG